MRKLAAALTLLLIMLPACQKKTVQPPPAPLSFSARLFIKTNSLELECDWERSQPGIAMFCVAAPQELEGLTLSLAGTQCRAEFKGLRSEVEIPAQAFFCELMEAVSAKDGITSTDKGGSIESRGTISTGAFIIRQDPLTGAYQYIELPHGSAQVITR
ncbi:MAG: hypothetical protein LBQ80_01300 [Clostridium sp.]|jgi:hypothetical protein|nr:hypothetical protein [Clostridium sp.]